jgi:hypothetical protein
MTDAPEPALGDANAVRMGEVAWEIGWRDGDVVRIAFRVDGQPSPTLTLYGASAKDVVRAVCRTLQLPPAAIAAEPVMVPIRRFGRPDRQGPAHDMAWIVAVGGPEPGRALARIVGLGAGMAGIGILSARRDPWRPDPDARGLRVNPFPQQEAA